MVKVCPDLVTFNEHQGNLLGSGMIRQVVLNECLQDKCIAFNNGKCAKYDSSVKEKKEEHFDNQPLSINDLKLFIRKPIFNKIRKEWFLLIGVRDIDNKEIDVISVNKQYKETYGFRKNCFYPREVKEDG